MAAPSWSSRITCGRRSAWRLAGQSVRARVVSLPSFEIFDMQPADYKESVLPNKLRKRLAIEAASPFGWERYVGLDGAIHGINRFGASAKYKDLQKEFGFLPEDVAKQVEGMLGK